MMSIKENKFAFTLIEIIVVVIIVGILASFSIPQYGKSIDKNYERDMLTQLRSIHAANEIYNASANEYLQDGGAALALPAINSNFSINIIPNGVTYTYDSTSVSAYTADAVRGGTRLRVDEGPLDSTNPCCVGGGCLLSLTSC